MVLKPLVYSNLKKINDDGDINRKELIQMQKLSHCLSLLIFYVSSIQKACFFFLMHSYKMYLLSFVDILIILSLKDQRTNQQCENDDMGPLTLNAFDMIILSQGLNLATLFDRGQVFNHDVSANSQIIAHLTY